MHGPRSLVRLKRLIQSIRKPKEVENNSTVAFGGVNVIIAGDSHQFPPVIGGSGNGALHTLIGPTAANILLARCPIYKQFRTFVLLKKQFRFDNESWRGVLARA
jgi:hypothetical protein